MKNWQRKLDQRDVVVGVLGLGYVGLPLAREFVSAGIKLVGSLTDKCRSIACKLYEYD